MFRFTNCPDMTITVYYECKTTNNNSLISNLAAVGEMQGSVVQSIVSSTSLLRGQLVQCFSTTLIFLLKKSEAFAKASQVFSTNKRAMMALGRSPEYHWNQIISKSVHRFSRSRLKFFSIYSPGGQFLQQSRMV